MLKSTRQRSFQKTDFKNRKQKRFNSGRTPPASHTPVPSKLQVVTFFAHHAAGKIRTHDISLTCNLLYHYTTQSLVSILHFSPTYYTKPRVYCLFEALNEFKLKSCQLQSFITFRDLQLSFWKFLHPKPFTKFEVHFVVCQIYDTRQSLVICRVALSGTGQTSIFLNLYTFIISR